MIDRISLSVGANCLYVLWFQMCWLIMLGWLGTGKIPLKKAKPVYCVQSFIFKDSWHRDPQEGNGWGKNFYCFLRPSHCLLCFLYFFPIVLSLCLSRSLLQEAQAEWTLLSSLLCHNNSCQGEGPPLSWTPKTHMHNSMNPPPDLLRSLPKTRKRKTATERKLTKPVWKGFIGKRSFKVVQCIFVSFFVLLFKRLKQVDH